MISPIEIKKQEFGKSLSGYNRSEVRIFLENVATDFEKICEQNRKLSEENEKLKTEIQTFQRLESEMKQALASAEETKHQVVDQSEREALLLRKEAELEGEKIIREAQRRYDEVINEIRDLEYRRDAFIRKLKGILKSEMELIDVLDMDTNTKSDTSSKLSSSKEVDDVQNENINQCDKNTENE